MAVAAAAAALKDSTTKFKFGFQPESLSGALEFALEDSLNAMMNYAMDITKQFILNLFCNPRAFAYAAATIMQIAKEST